MISYPREENQGFYLVLNKMLRFLRGTELTIGNTLSSPVTMEITGEDNAHLQTLLHYRLHVVSPQLLIPNLNRNRIAREFSLWHINNSFMRFRPRPPYYMGLGSSCGYDFSSDRDRTLISWTTSNILEFPNERKWPAISDDSNETYPVNNEMSYKDPRRTTNSELI